MYNSLATFYLFDPETGPQEPPTLLLLLLGLLSDFSSTKAFSFQPIVIKHHIILHNHPVTDFQDESKLINNKPVGDMVRSLIVASPL